MSTVDLATNFAAPAASPQTKPKSNWNLARVIRLTELRVTLHISVPPSEVEAKHRRVRMPQFGSTLKTIHRNGTLSKHGEYLM
jgi:hypothetical protein